MKKKLALLLAVVSFATCLSAFGCSDEPSANTSTPGESVGEETTVEVDTPIYDEENPNGVFVQEGRTEYVIVKPQAATQNETHCADELKRYILLASGCDMEIVTDEGKSFSRNDKVISVGKTVYQAGAGIDSSVYADFTTGGFLIKNVGSAYVIDSAVSEGVLYGAYEFLNAFFGVEFLTYDDTYIPKSETVKAYAIDYSSIPAFAIRDFYSYAVWHHGAEYGAKLRMNSTTFPSSASVNEDYKYYSYYYEQNGTQQYTMREGHSLGEMLKAAAYVDGYIPDPGYKTSDNGALSTMALGYWGQHPEWYAYNPKGERVNPAGYSQEEFCYTNGLDENFHYIQQAEDVANEEMTLPTRIIALCKDMILQDQARGGSAKYLMLGHGDFSAQCQCENCLKLYEQYGGFSAATIIWAKEIAEKVYEWMEEENIDKEVKFVIFAYYKSFVAPAKKVGATYVPNDERLVLDDDFYVKMAYRNCVYHSLWDESCTHNEELRTSFDSWHCLAQNFTIWDYTVNFEDYLWYMPNFGTLQDNYKYYQTLNVEHLLSQGAPSEYNFYENHLHMWVSCKLMWNPNQDVNRLIKRFNEMYFGEYASYVNEYRDLFENHFAVLDATEEGGFHASTTGSLDFKSADKYPVALLQSAESVIQKAIDAVRADDSMTNDEKDSLELKLRSVKITPQYMMLYLKLVQNEEEEKEMAKDFFESVDMLKLIYMREGRTDNNLFETMRKTYGV